MSREEKNREWRIEEKDRRKGCFDEVVRLYVLPRAVPIKVVRASLSSSGPKGWLAAMTRPTRQSTRERTKKKTRQTRVQLKRAISKHLASSLVTPERVFATEITSMRQTLLFWKHHTQHMQRSLGNTALLLCA